MVVCVGKNVFFDGKYYSVGERNSAKMSFELLYSYATPDPLRIFHRHAMDVAKSAPSDTLFNAQPVVLSSDAMMRSETVVVNKSTDLIAMQHTQTHRKTHGSTNTT